MVAELVQHRAQGTGHLDRIRNVAAHIGAVLAGSRRIMVAQNSRMQSQGEAILGGHPHLIHQQMPAQRGGLIHVDLAPAGLAVQPLGGGGVQEVGDQVAVGVISADGALRLEVRPPVLHGCGIAGQRRGVLARGLGQLVDQLVPVGASRLEVLVGTEGGGHPVLRAELGIGRDDLVVAQIVRRVVGGGDERDVELVH